MLRSPISPASFCTFARSSSRNTTSSGDSGSAFEIFLPGIFTPNHQSNARIAATAMVMRSTLKRIFEREAEGISGFSYLIVSGSRDHGSKPRCAESEEQGRHHNENGKLRPVFEEICPTQNDGTHERDEIGRGEERAKRIKNPRHRFAWKNETGKEDTRQQEHHRHLERLHLVFGLSSDHQAKAQQREDVN